MKDPTGNPSRGERSAATSAVRAAAAHGRIVAADAEMRMAQIRAARSRTELELVVRDLSAGAPAAAYPSLRDRPAATAPEGPRPGYSQPPLAPPYSSPQPWRPASARRTSSRSGLAIGTVVTLVVIGSAVSGVVSAGSSDSTSSTRTDPIVVDPRPQAPRVVPIVLADAGFDALLGDLRRRTGSTEVYQAVLYASYVEVEVPAGAGNRADLYYWDGAFSDRQSTAVPRRQRVVDLAEVDPAVLRGLVRRAKSLLADPSSSYVVVGRVSGSRIGLRAFATDDAERTARVDATLEGGVVGTQPAGA